MGVRGRRRGRSGSTHAPLCVAGAVLQVVMLLAVFGSSVLTSTAIINLMFDGALVALLLHPMSREYQRIWFK